MSLRRPTFSTRRLAEAYDMGEVDDAIDRIFAALAADPPAMAPEQVSGLRFTPTRLRDGYAMTEVDQWLDEAAAELAARGGRAGAEPTTAATTAPTTRASASSDAIVEVRGSRTRLVVVLVGVAVLVVAMWAYYSGR
ncbi:DivIVA domain-containing protein [Nocardioides cavernae]|uniref:DivIVA domain-containing protein n=1 Tax=Nocardioides cavernae TaxID=1921566 RepID=A0A7Y9H0E3_9ACTN|nr:DivIVA domain-containing protein [Nocardioides cavernae]NYE35675.1 DivIVA domain-containing protein [Nocardioides cavernae]